MIFLFPRWDMLIPWRVVDFLLVKLHGSGVKLHNYFFVIGKDFPKVGVSWSKLTHVFFVLRWVVQPPTRLYRYMNIPVPWKVWILSIWMLGHEKFTCLNCTNTWHQKLQQRVPGWFLRSWNLHDFFLLNVKHPEALTVEEYWLLKRLCQEWECPKYLNVINQFILLKPNPHVSFARIVQWLYIRCFFVWTKMCFMCYCTVFFLGGSSTFGYCITIHQLHRWWLSWDQAWNPWCLDGASIKVWNLGFTEEIREIWIGPILLHSPGRKLGSLKRLI